MFYCLFLAISIDWGRKNLITNWKEWSKFVCFKWKNSITKSAITDFPPKFEQSVQDTAVQALPTDRTVCKRACMPLCAWRCRAKKEGRCKWLIKNDIFETLNIFGNGKFLLTIEKKQLIIAILREAMPPLRPTLCVGLLMTRARCPNSFFPLLYSNCPSKSSTRWWTFLIIISRLRSANTLIKKNNVASDATVLMLMVTMNFVSLTKNCHLMLCPTWKSPTLTPSDSCRPRWTRLNLVSSWTIQMTTHWRWKYCRLTNWCKQTKKIRVSKFCNPYWKLTRFQSNTSLRRPIWCKLSSLASLHLSQPTRLPSRRWAASAKCNWWALPWRATPCSPLWPSMEPLQFKIISK